MKRTSKHLRESIADFSDDNGMDIADILDTAMKLPYLSLVKITEEARCGPKGWLIMQYLVREGVYWELKRARR